MCGLLRVAAGLAGDGGREDGDVEESHERAASDFEHTQQGDPGVMGGEAAAGLKK
jgi:hypothetical protein